MTNLRLFTTTAVIVCLIALGIGIGVYSARYYRDRTPSAIEGMLWPHPKELKPFATIDQTGNLFDLERFQGKWSFLFFGYTHCPDVCPATLSILNQVTTRLRQSGQAEVVQVLFVSADPERDTPQQLADYLGRINPEFIGLGGMPAQVRSLTGQIGVVAVPGEQAANGDYRVNHSTAIFLIDPAARLLSVYSAPHHVESILARFEKIRSFINKKHKG
ncbi:MAG: SCO family protein [Gammaproteobacteria bacterium]